MFKIVEFSHILIQEFYKRNKNKNLIFIDATCGNGNDTLFLAKTLNHVGTVIAYDIQKKAIEETQKLLANANFNNVIYHLSSHEYIIEDDFDLIIYNLGYLPGSDKKITTHANSTLNSIKKTLAIINLKKEEPGNEKPLFIGIAQYAFLYDLCCKLKQDNGQ